MTTSKVSSANPDSVHPSAAASRPDRISYIFPDSLSPFQHLLCVVNSRHRITCLRQKSSGRIRAGSDIENLHLFFLLETAPLIHAAIASLGFPPVLFIDLRIPSAGFPSRRQFPVIIPVPYLPLLSSFLNFPGAAVFQPLKYPLLYQKSAFFTSPHGDILNAGAGYSGDRPFDCGTSDDPACRLSQRLPMSRIIPSPSVRIL